MSDHAHYSGSWSSWIPTNSDHTRYYRTRLDETGASQYEYTTSPAIDPAVPRRDDTNLESGFGTMSISDSYPHYQYNQSFNQGSYGYTAAYGGSGDTAFTSITGVQAHHYDMPPPQGHSSSSKKGKGLDTGVAKSKKSSRAPSHKDREKKSKKQPSSSKQKRDPVQNQLDPFYARSDPDTSSAHGHSKGEVDVQEEGFGPFYEPPATGRDAPSAEYLSPATANAEGAAFDEGDQYRGTDPTYASPWADYRTEEHPQEPEQSGHRSRYQTKGTYSRPSGSGKQKQSSSSHAEDPDEEAFNAAVENSDAYHPGAGEYPDDEDAENATPKAGSPHPGLDFDDGSRGAELSSYSNHSSNPPFYSSAFLGHPSGNPGDIEYQNEVGETYVDDRYVIEPSSRFEPGEVFKILWSEPRGGRDSVSEEEISHEEYESMGHKFYTGFRRFVVVANDMGHCTCVPILTYERRACTKKGVKPEKHGIAYALHGRPQLLAKEPKLGFEPVRIELDYVTEKLAKESRINYSKLVTVEHNVQVFFIGRIVEEDFDIVTQAVDKCWTDKLRITSGGESSRHRRRPKR